MTSHSQSPHWLDKLIDQVKIWQKDHRVDQIHVDDMKTPSGRVHTGALRGVILHDLIAQALAKQSLNVISTYVFNDMDPMDALPGYLDPQVYSAQMGKPLYQIPAPKLEESGLDVSLMSQTELDELKAARSFAEVYALDFQHAFRRLGCNPQIIWSHQLYESGQMDQAIKTALDNIDKIKQVYRQVADYQLPDNWYPFQVICPKCGKVGTTLTTDWDGEKVSFECQEHKVEWAKGCGYSGKISPFGATGKLLWKVDWPAHWATLGINLEGAGKDHSSAGGSRDMANQLIEQVFAHIKPFDVPYEWILIKGAKMSSSKGVGTSAREFVNLFPSTVGRFLFASHYYGQVIDFDPYSMAIPDLFDEFDLAAQIYWHQADGDQRLARSFELSQIDGPVEPHFLPRFRDVALWMQYPEIDLREKFATIKGAKLNDLEIGELNDRTKYAKIWIEKYAPVDYQFTPKVGQSTEPLASDQKIYLQEILALLNSQTNWTPEDLQQQLYELAKKTLGVKKGFEAIYLSLIGKKSGPRAAWLLLNTDKSLLNKIINR